MAATGVNRKITSQDVIDGLFNLFIFRGIPEHVQSDNGPKVILTTATT